MREFPSASKLFILLGIFVVVFVVVNTPMPKGQLQKERKQTTKEANSRALGL